MPTCICILFLAVLKCYLAVGQKSLRKSRIPLLHLASAKHRTSAGWFPLLLPKFQHRQLRRNQPLTWNPFFLPPPPSLDGQSPFAKSSLFCFLLPCRKTALHVSVRYLQRSLWKSGVSLLLAMFWYPSTAIIPHGDKKKKKRKQTHHTSVVRFTACMVVSSQSQLCSISGEFDLPSDGSLNLDAFLTIVVSLISLCYTFLWKLRNVCIQIWCFLSFPECIG